LLSLSRALLSSAELEEQSRVCTAHASRYVSRHKGKKGRETSCEKGPRADDDDDDDRTRGRALRGVRRTGGGRARCADKEREERGHERERRVCGCENENRAGEREGKAKVGEEARAGKEGGYREGYRGCAHGGARA